MRKSKTLLQLLLLAANYIIAKVFFLDDNGFNIIKIHMFLFFLFLIADLVKKRIFKNKKAIPAKLFIINIGRILLCILFLFSSIIEGAESKSFYIYNFLTIYFIYLFLDLIKLKIKKSK